MLCLSRLKGQAIMIGNIKVTVVKVRGSQVSLSIDAPPEVRIRRGELKPPNKGDE